MNARKAGVPMRIERASIREMEPTEPPGFIVTNPPYGERLPGTRELFRELGSALRLMRGHRVSVLAGTPEIARAIPSRPVKSLIVYNGAIECRLLSYEI
jgi:putative N6-adenine-specific DNA methylase